MKLFTAFCILAIIFVAVLTQQSEAKAGSCIGCTLVVTILEQVALAHPSMKLKDAAVYWCQALGGSQEWLVTACSSALSTIAPVIEIDWKLGATPDETCRKLTMCQGEEATCALWPRNESFQAASHQTELFTPLDREVFQGFFDETEAIFDYIFGAALNWSEDGAIKTFVDFPALARHQPQAMTESAGSDFWYLHPFVDNDKDDFSTFGQLRGSTWRGKDCDENNSAIYPTRQARSAKTQDANVDHNCNGIYGVDEQGQDIEKTWCGSTKQFQVVALGDSATAHFALPPCWLSGACIKPGTYKSFVDIAMNEMDFPQCSMVTGYDQQSCPSLSTSLAPFQSIYNYARTRNACVHRQYQNLGINGAAYKNYAPKLKASFNPNPLTDAPSMVFFNLIGNDVCNKKTDPSTMTSESDYKIGLVESLEHLDTVLTPGSRVFVSGLVDGRLLYETMGERQHPAGMKYSSFYSYLNCMNTSPCAGWMNTNSTIRDATTAHARKLARVAQEVVATYKFNNFKLHYNDVETHFSNMIARFKAEGKDASRLIEATDGFHPSSSTNSLLAASIIAELKMNATIHDDIFPLNPFNDKIRQRFGPELNGY